MRGYMKKRILTLSILSSVLNLNQTLAHDIAMVKYDSTINVMEKSNLFAMGHFQVKELTDNALRVGVENAVFNLVIASRLKSNENDYGEKADKLETALANLEEQISILDHQQPESSIEIKSKILGELLRTGVVVTDKEEVERSERMFFDFNSSIVKELEDRHIVLNKYAKGGIICLH